MSTPERSPLITAIEITKLFGRKNYSVPFPSHNGAPGRMILLHGDNGSGKTTLLRLVWNALSAADNRGHRTFIARTPFDRLKISMSGERSLIIKKTDGLQGSFSITLIRPDQDDVVTEYEADEDGRIRNGFSRGRIYSREFERMRARDLSRLSAADLDVFYGDTDKEQAARQAEEAYLEFLAQEVSNPLYLADDRSLYSDDEDIHRTRELLSRRDDGEKNSQDRLSRLVFIELQVTIRRVNDYLRSLTLGGQNDGSASSNSIYVNVLKQLATTAEMTGGTTESSADALLHDIARIAPDFEEFGLVPKFDSSEFQTYLDSVHDSDRRDLADRVVKPFLSSQKARYAALEEAESLLRALVPAINGFFREKELRFSPREGLRIVAGDNSPLEVEALSSGERQLLMLLCTTLLARVDTRIFIIDEPELSLGVEWQRKILDALLGLTEKSGVQFLVATHSIEIISGHPEALAILAE